MTRRSAAGVLLLVAMGVPNPVPASTTIGRMTFYIGQASDAPYLRIIEPVPGSSVGELLAADVAVPVRFCPADSEFVCLDDDSAYAFAFPRRGPVPASWEHRHISCVRIGEKFDLTLLGRTIEDVFAVRCHGADRRDVSFVYSRASGILGIGNTGAPYWTGTYWLQESLGPCAIRE